MIIDCHGHYTVLPKAHDEWREAQIAAFEAGREAPPYPEISDAEIRQTIEDNQLKLIEERGADLTIFSPRASTMAHHVGDQAVSAEWAQRCNDLIHRVKQLFPETFAGVCMLPQSPKADLAESITELRRCVEELGFVGCNLNPDPGGGHFTAPPLTDEYWFPIYEEMTRLNVPAMIHVSGSCNPAMHATGGFYIAADTVAFMQLLQGDLFARFPTLRLIIPHGGGAVPYHWGRYRGLADMLKQPGLDTHLMNNVFFDTCVYHQPGIDLLADVIDTRNILFGSEMVGAVRGIDPKTGHHFDDTRRYIDALHISEADRAAIFAGNARVSAARRETKEARIVSSETGRAPTTHASRYLQQLAKHWAHNNEVSFDKTRADIALRGNLVELRAEPDALIATLTTGPEGDAARLRQVLEDHINRFAFREAPLPFEWSAS